MKKIKYIALCLLVIGGLTACSEVRPFEDSRREAGRVKPIGQSTPGRVAVCYNPLWDSDEEVLVIAAESCAKQGKKPEFSDKSYFNCRFMTPNTAFYSCR